MKKPRNNSRCITTSVASVAASIYFPLKKIQILYPVGVEISRFLSKFTAETIRIRQFSKHTSAAEFPKISAVWQSISSQLAKENRKSVYKVVRPGARAREYENAIVWLREAGLIYQIYCCTKPGMPMSAFDDIRCFKIYLLDVGLFANLHSSLTFMIRWRHKSVFLKILWNTLLYIDGFACRHLSPSRLLSTRRCLIG